MTDPVLIVDREGTIKHANDAARTTLGAHTGGSCFSTVRGRDHVGRTVCGATCPRRLHQGEPRVDQVHQVRDRPARLVCSKVGEVVTVIVREVFELPKHGLSEREREVLQLVASGLTDGEVGERLGISTATARTHVENVRHKLGARSRTEAVARALTLGVIQLVLTP